MNWLISCFLSLAFIVRVEGFAPASHKHFALPNLYNIADDENGFSLSNDGEYFEDTAEDNVSDGRIRFRCRVAYDGSNYRGWQVQAQGRTGQGELEKTLSRRFNRTVKIVGAGRTDAGVHARGQAIHFDVYPHEIVAKGDIDDGLDDCGHFCRQLQRSLNGMLEQDMRVYNITKSPPPVDFKLRDGSVRKLKWHVIYSAERKLYTYRISLKPKSVTADPMQRYTRVHVDGNLDPEYLQNILHHYEGEHDFRAFAGAIEANQRKQGIGMKDTVRTVYSIKLIDEENGNYRIEILLKGALYKMVRNMVGTALDVSMGRLDENAMLQMLNHSPDEGEAPKQFVRKDNKCKPAPPEGLTLEKVYFDDDDF